MSQVETSEEITLDDVFEDQVADEKSEPVIETIQVETEDSTTESEPDEVPEKNAQEKDSPEKWTFQMAMDEREKRQKAVKEADDLRKRLEAIEQTKPPSIDIFEDQEGWKADLEKRNQAALTNALLDQSQALAEREFGKDKVSEAVEWFKEAAPRSPYLLERFNSTSLKHHEIMELFTQERERASMNDLPAYKAKLKAELLAEIEAEQGKPTRNSITPSLAGKRSAATDSVSIDDLNDIPLDR